MELFTPLILAVCLSADAFAVSVTNGLCSNRNDMKNAAATGLTFGFFQGIMPLAGYLSGYNFTGLISRYHHLVALILLCAIGINMIAESIRERKNKEERCLYKNVFSAKNLILQGIATSIDALAAGVGMLAMELNILFTSVIIGGITCIFCTIGVLIGKKFGTLLGLQARLVGGCILILIGVKIFLEHQL